MRGSGLGPPLALLRQEWLQPVLLEHSPEHCSLGGKKELHPLLELQQHRGAGQPSPVRVWLQVLVWSVLV